MQFILAREDSVWKGSLTDTVIAGVCVCVCVCSDNGVDGCVWGYRVRDKMRIRVERLI